jgi:hypothetical protein
VSAPSVIVCWEHVFSLTCSLRTDPNQDQSSGQYKSFCASLLRHCWSDKTPVTDSPFLDSIFLLFHLSSSTHPISLSPPTAPLSPRRAAFNGEASVPRTGVLASSPSKNQQPSSVALFLSIGAAIFVANWYLSLVEEVTSPPEQPSTLAGKTNIETSLRLAAWPYRSHATGIS